VPLLLDLVGRHYPGYAGSAWDAVLLLFALMYVGAAACWFFLKTNGTVLDHSLGTRARDAEDAREE
ncbi:MAG: hypothetical protein VX644_01605, partial [Planctomycetota bacterium]|nr:hypothetical protein [Planctomycetota bacterium]